MNNNQDMDSADKVIAQESMMNNMRQIDTLRSIMMIASGCTSGIIQCVNHEGFICFAIAYILSAVAIGMTIQFNFKTYLNMSFLEFLVHDASRHIMSFVLFWTLAYALVYIY